MATFKTFQEVEVWQKAMDLIEKIYLITNNKTFSSDYNLVNQIRRSAISVASNIAEGMERDGNKELINFLYISKGSCGELHCQLMIAQRIGYLDMNNFSELSNLATEIGKSLGGLITYLKDSEFKGKKYK